MILLPAGSDDEVALWHTLIDLAERADDWTLIGARMVELHAAEAGRTLLRTSLDGDVLADARSRPNAVRRVAQILLADDVKLEEPSYTGGLLLGVRPAALFQEEAHGSSLQRTAMRLRGSSLPLERLPAVRFG